MEPIKVIIDIGRSIPRTVGTINGRIRTFSKDDVNAILDCVAEIIQTESEKKYVVDILKTLSDEEYIRWNISFFGSIHPGVFADICVRLDKWSEIYGVEYIQPFGLPYEVFSLDDY